MPGLFLCDLGALGGNFFSVILNLFQNLKKDPEINSG